MEEVTEVDGQILDATTQLRPVPRQKPLLSSSQLKLIAFILTFISTGYFLSLSMTTLTGLSGFCFGLIISFFLREIALNTLTYVHKHAITAEAVFVYKGKGIYHKHLINDIINIWIDEDHHIEKMDGLAISTQSHTVSFVTKDGSQHIFDGYTKVHCRKIESLIKHYMEQNKVEVHNVVQNVTHNITTNVDVNAIAPDAKGSNECLYCGATFVRKMAMCPHCGALLAEDTK